MKSAFKIFLIFLMFLSFFSYAREDNKTYVKDLHTVAVWIKPQNIKVYVAPSGRKDEILYSSFEIWQDALRGDIRFNFVNSEQEADITVKYVDKLTDNRLGITKSSHINIQGRIYLHKTAIEVARHDPRGFIRNDAELRKTTLHEIAHAIGVLGHSTHISDIMYPTTASAQSVPSKRDIETVQGIYGF